MDSKIITFLKDESLSISNESVKISDLDSNLERSINIGIKWLNENIVAKKDQFGDYAQKLEYLENMILNNITYSYKYNQIIMNAAHMWLKIIHDKHNKRNRKRQSFKCENTIPIESKSYTEYFMVEINPGLFHKFMRIPHDDHFDFLPCEQFQLHA